jgi:hypothetical protein
MLLIGNVLDSHLSNLKVYFYFHNLMQLIPILSQMNPLHIITPYLWSILAFLAQDISVNHTVWYKWGMRLIEAFEAFMCHYVFILKYSTYLKRERNWTFLAHFSLFLNNESMPVPSPCCLCVIVSPPLPQLTYDWPNQSSWNLVCISWHLSPS